MLQLVPEGQDQAVSAEQPVPNMAPSLPVHSRHTISRTKVYPVFKDAIIRKVTEDTRNQEPSRSPCGVGCPEGPHNHEWRHTNDPSYEIRKVREDGKCASLQTGSGYQPSPVIGKKSQRHDEYLFHETVPEAVARLDPTGPGAFLMRHGTVEDFSDTDNPIKNNFSNVRQRELYKRVQDSPQVKEARPRSTEHHREQKEDKIRQERENDPVEQEMRPQYLKWREKELKKMNKKWLGSHRLYLFFHPKQRRDEAKHRKASNIPQRSNTAAREYYERMRVVGASRLLCDKVKVTMSRSFSALESIMGGAKNGGSDLVPNPTYVPPTSHAASPMDSIVEEELIPRRELTKNEEEMVKSVRRVSLSPAPDGRIVMRGDEPDEFDAPTIRTIPAPRVEDISRVPRTWPQPSGSRNSIYGQETHQPSVEISGRRVHSESSARILEQLKKQKRIVSDDLRTTRESDEDDEMDSPPPKNRLPPRNSDKARTRTNLSDIANEPPRLRLHGGKNPFVRDEVLDASVLAFAREERVGSPERGCRKERRTVSQTQEWVGAENKGAGSLRPGEAHRAVKKGTSEQWLNRDNLSKQSEDDSNRSAMSRTSSGQDHAYQSSSRRLRTPSPPQDPNLLMVPPHRQSRRRH